MTCKLYLHIAAESFYLKFVAVYKTVISHKLSHASDAVSAHHSLGAVKVEDTHFSCCLVGTADKNDTVSADTEVSVRKGKRHTLGVVDLLVKAVEVDIVISAAMHLCEVVCVLFTSEVVDVNKLGVRLGILASDRRGYRICSIYRGKTRDIPLYCLSSYLYRVTGGYSAL